MRGLVHTTDGWEYHSDNRKYSLYEGISIESQSQLSSDLLFIMDDLDVDRNVEMVGYLWGADFIRQPSYRNEWEKHIQELVERYESREHMPNGIERLEHARKYVKGYYDFFDDGSIEEKELKEIEKDIEYLTTLIEKAKEMQRN